MLTRVLRDWELIGVGAEKCVYHNGGPFVVKVTHREDQLAELEATYEDTCNWKAHNLQEWENWKVIRKFPWLLRFFAAIVGQPKWCPIHKQWYYLQEYIPIGPEATETDSEIVGTLCEPIGLWDAEYQFHVVPSRGVVIYDFGFDRAHSKALEDGWTLNSDGSVIAIECGTKSVSNTIVATIPDGLLKSM